MLKKSFSNCLQLQKKEQNNKHNREQTKADVHETEACKMFRIACPLSPSECNISRRISFAVFESSCAVEMFILEAFKNREATDLS